MTIGEYEIDDAGMIKHLKCKEPAGTWSFTHRCWNPGHSTDGRYIMVVCPLMVQTISKIRYAAWNNEWAKLNTSS